MEQIGQLVVVILDPPSGGQGQLKSLGTQLSQDMLLVTM